jgi:hypothetical protein
MTMKKKSTKRPRSPFKGERSADMMPWAQNGATGRSPARLAADVVLSVGRTDSERALGFLLYADGDKKLPKFENDQIDFVLDRDQIEELIGYLQSQLGRLRKPLGRRVGFGMFSSARNPKQRLEMKLEDAAMRAHPRYEMEGELSEMGVIEFDDDAPRGDKLIKWFKRTHPRKAQRIERDFEKRLWAGQL